MFGGQNGIEPRKSRGYMRIFFFKEFHPWGGDENYLHDWAMQVDRMLAEGWVVHECRRQRERPAAHRKRRVKCGGR